MPITQEAIPSQTPMFEFKFGTGSLACPDERSESGPVPIAVRRVGVGPALMYEFKFGMGDPAYLHKTIITFLFAKGQ